MTGCLYEVLGVARDAPQEEIKKAYRQRALQLHPDKNPGNEDAKAKFQLLQKVYAILGDEEKRKVYDQTGITDDDDLAGAGFDGLVDYFRAMFAIRTEDIDDFTARYQGSADERADLLRYYQQFRGRMETVFDHLMCSDPVFDSHRLRDLLEEAIEAGEVQRFKPYTAWAKSVVSRPRPPLRRTSTGAGHNGPGTALIAAIHSKRAAAANSFFDSLAAKYGGQGGKEKAKEKGKKRGKAEQSAIEVVAEPTDSEFEAARRRLEERQASKGSGATSRERPGGKRSQAIEKAGAAMAIEKGKRRSRAAALSIEDDNDEDSDAARAQEQEMDDVAAPELENGKDEDGGMRSGKRPAKKARRSEGGRASVGDITPDAAAADAPSGKQQRKSAKKQKRKSGAQEQVEAADGAEGDDEEHGEGRLAAGAGGDGNSGEKRLLEAKHAAATAAGQAEAAEATDREVGKRKVKDKKDKGDADADAGRGAEKENKGGAALAAVEKNKKGKRKDNRLSGAGGEVDGRSGGGLSSREAKRALA